MKMIFLGAPGVGKGTQAKILSERTGIPHISTGDMLRSAVRAGSELGKKAGAIMEGGQLVPDSLIIDLIKERTSQDDCRSGYILDGFPRTVKQADALNQMLKERGEHISHVIYFTLPESELLARLTHRRGAEARADDTVEVQKERLRVYQEQTAPLVDYYHGKKLLSEIPSEGNVEEVFARLLKVVSP